jgi:predicted molibdopterin-dependent oxidoreductase YjgC
MCDIGRFDYHWIEGDSRLRRPLERVGDIQRPVAWHEALSKLRDRLAAVGTVSREGVRFLLSAHASHEELFLFRRLAEDVVGSNAGAITVGWRVTPRHQPAHTTFKVPAVAAPNVNGARMLGLVEGRENEEAADVSRLRSAVEEGRVPALYVFDPGPEGSIGDTQWIVNARTRGKLGLLIVQGVLMTDLSRAADFVLPGASYVEKEASYTNDQGRLQGTARVIPAPGEAMEDWQILVKVSAALDTPLDYQTTAHVRAAIAARFPGVPGLEGITSLAFSRPVPAHHWLEASNPSERWKWDFMFQDLPPVKGTVDPSALPAPPGMIPLREVK